MSEAMFSIDELFFSRTDARGKIKAGNAVFQRVSQFTWEEMIDKPHNIIRHPSMPRAVFYVLWDQIRSGRPVGAYVNNRSKDGSHYWVFAVVTPVEDGYLSVRLKPGSGFFAAAQNLYSDVLRDEAEKNLKPAESAHGLIAKLRSLGFKDYEHFMTTALNHEIKTRDAAMGRPFSSNLTSIETLMSASGSLLSAVSRVAETNWMFRYAPMNLRMQATGLGQEANAIGVISSNYGLLSSNIESKLDELDGLAKAVSASVTEGLFLSCIAKLQEEMAHLFEKELSQSSGSSAREQAALLRQTELYRLKASEMLRVIEGRIQHFFDVTAEMKRLASALAAVRVMGKVESARSGQGVFDDLIADLEACQKTIATGLHEIGIINNTMRESFETLASASGRGADATRRGPPPSC
ncbi:MAG TPA: hypothetical protein DIC56_07090 [Rhizobium sp.]|nr:hypothetical protein [Rhizobium sp.]